MTRAQPQAPESAEPSPADSLALNALAARYLRGLDERTVNESWARSVFADEISLVFPIGKHRGIPGVAEFTDGLLRPWARTHHHGSPCVIEMVEGDAMVSWSVVATHIPPGALQDPSVPNLTLGGWFSGLAAVTGIGWRFKTLSLKVSWMTGRAAPGVEVDPGQLA